MGKTIQENSTADSSNYNGTVESAKTTIDSMIASICEKLDLEEYPVLDSIIRSGSLELEDSTTIAYHGMVKNGTIQDTHLIISCNNGKSRWEINGARERYQILNIEYGDKKVKNPLGAEIYETISSRSRQYEGTTIFSIDNQIRTKLEQNEISGYETIKTFGSAPALRDYSLFLKKGDNIEYKGEYDSGRLKMIIMDGSYNEQKLDEYHQERALFGFKPPEKKSEKKVQEMLKTREEILQKCDSLLSEAQQLVDLTLERIEREKRVSTNARRVFGNLLGSESLQGLKAQCQGLEKEEVDLYLQTQEDRGKKGGESELQ